MFYMEVSVAKGMYTLYGQLNLADRPQEGGRRVVEGRLIDGNINAFNANDSIADFTGDGVFDFFDVSAFLNAYNAGCP